MKDCLQTNNVENIQKHWKYRGLYNNYKINLKEFKGGQLNTFQKLNIYAMKDAY